MRNATLSRYLFTTLRSCKARFCATTFLSSEWKDFMTLDEVEQMCKQSRFRSTTT